MKRTEENTSILCKNWSLPAPTTTYGMQPGDAPSRCVIAQLEEDLAEVEPGLEVARIRSHLRRVRGLRLLEAALLVVEEPEVELRQREARVILDDLLQQRLLARANCLTSMRQPARFKRFWLSSGWTSTAFSR